MAEILAAIQHPLSLCGFVLILVFRLLKNRIADRYPSVYPVFMVMAVLTLAAGLGLAYLEAVKGPAPAPDIGTETTPAKTSRTPQPSVKQTTKGAQSPAVANIKGDVNITLGTPKKKKEQGAKE